MLKKSSENTEKLTNSMFELETHRNKLLSHQVNYQSSLSRLRFIENDDWYPTFENIGKIEGINSNEISANKSSEIQNNVDKKEIKLKFKPYASCELKNGNIVVTDFENHRAVLFDNNFKVLNEVSSAGDFNFKYPAGICTDYDEVFLCDQYNNRVIVFDLDLENVKKVIAEDLHNPIDVRCHSGKMYILNNASKQIKVFNVDGSFEKDVHLVDNENSPIVNPRSFDIFGDFIGINDNFQSIFISSLKDFKLMQKIETEKDMKFMGMYLHNGYLNVHEMKLLKNESIHYLNSYENLDSGYGCEWTKISKREFQRGSLTRSYSLTKIGDLIASCLFESKSIVLV